MSEDNKIMEQEEESRNHDDFLVSMSKIGKSDGRFRLQHKNDETQVLNQPLSELMGQNVTIENILTAAVAGPNFENEGKASGKKNNTQLGKDFKKSYEKSVGKHQNLRLTAPASTVQEGKGFKFNSLSYLDWTKFLFNLLHPVFIHYESR